MPKARIILGDCLDALKAIKSGSVDAIVTDPPYGQTNEKYDRGVPPEVWRECYRVARPNAALISFAGSPTYHRIASGIEAAGWRVRQMWAWVYRDGFITSAWPKEGFDRLAPAFDPICYATKGKVILRLAKEGDTEWVRDEPRRGSTKPGYSERSGTHGAEIGKGRWPRQIVSTDDAEPFRYFMLSRTLGGFGWAREKTGHPNQKPLALMRWLVSKLPAGGVILDPYAGSATTLVASLTEGFDAIGIEANPEYHALAERRINEAASRIEAA